MTPPAKSLARPDVWVLVVHVQGGALKPDVAGAYVHVIVTGETIEIAIKTARDFCARESFTVLDVISCHKFDPHDHDELDELIRERGRTVQETGEPAFATFHAFPPEQTH
jgi:hypothetical protein